MRKLCVGLYDGGEQQHRFDQMDHVDIMQHVFSTGATLGSETGTVKKAFLYSTSAGVRYY